MITFIVFVLWYLNAPWWIFALSIIGVLIELDNSDLAKKEQLEKMCDVLKEMCRQIERR